MYPFDRASRQRLAGGATGGMEVDVKGVDVRGGQIADHDCAEVWEELAVEYRAGLADRGWRPPGRGDRVPSFEELADRGSGADGGTATGDVDHRGQFAFGFGTVAAHGFGSVAATPGRWIGAGEHAQLPRTGAALTH
jgi:hypothetical protein